MSRACLAIALLILLAACVSRNTDSPGGAPVSTQTSAPTFTTPSDTEIAVQHTFDAPRTHVWDAWTRCEHARNWMLGPPGWTMTICEVDLRPGGAKRVVWKDTQGAEMVIGGTYQEIRPPERLVLHERWGGDWPETINTLTFTEDRGRTTMKLTIRYPSTEARDAALATGMTDGMSYSFARAAEYIAQMR